MDELLPCPFCGGSKCCPPKVVKVESPWSREFWTVECNNCQASCGYSLEYEDAIEEWNDRPEGSAAALLAKAEKRIVVLEDVLSTRRKYED